MRWKWERDEIFSDVTWIGNNIVYGITHQQQHKFKNKNYWKKKIINELDTKEITDSDTRNRRINITK